jgi:LPXTG-motif cell wall-anchored protein
MGDITKAHRTISRDARRLLAMTLVVAALAAVAVGGAAAGGSGTASVAHDQYSSTKPLPPAAKKHVNGAAPTVVKTPTKVTGTLPFTGTNLTVAAGLGILLVGAGLLLRLRRSDD